MPTSKSCQVDCSQDRSQPLEALHPNESITACSDYLRGTLRQSLADPLTGGLGGDDHQLTKFHGIYLQDDRDLREERRRRKLEPAYQFMVRARLPGGVCQPEQWLKLDEIARTHGNASLRLTTRQTFQFHGVLKRNLKATIQGIHAALLDTIDRLGLDWFKGELAERLGWRLARARAFRFKTSQDRFGWSRNRDGSWNYTLFVENGRVKNADGHAMMDGLREIARLPRGDLRITPNKNLIVARIAEEAREGIARLLERQGILAATERSEARRHSMACVGLPTCPLSMAESERYFPELMTKIEALMAEVGLGDVPVIIRMSGCNNGCSRPYVAEIGFSGRAPGKYNVYLGGGFHGQRLSKPYLENVDEAAILECLKPLFARYARDGRRGESFGDFLIRAGYVPEMRDGPMFNA